jgi:octaprenyl-diphosphate synthase
MQALMTYFDRHLPYVEGQIQSIVSGLDPLIEPIARHVLDAGGKRLRPMLCVLTAELFGFKGPKVYPLASAVELFHSATLVHDDILDSAVLRRGQTAAHLAFGVQETVLAGDALLAKASEIVASYERDELIRIVSRAIMATTSGEIKEIAQLKKAEFTEADYFEIITNKTAVLIQAACECGAVLAQADARQLRAVGSLGRDLGVAFQLVDDALDYTSPEEKSGKPAGGDLREGKLTLPLLLYLKRLPQAEVKAIVSEVQAGRLSGGQQAKILAAVDELGLAAATREVASGYVAQARESLQDLPAGPLQETLGLVLDYVLYREK